MLRYYANNLALDLLYIYNKNLAKVSIEVYNSTAKDKLLLLLLL